MIKSFTSQRNCLPAFLFVMLTVMFFLSVQAQDMPLKGKVIDTKGQPLPGVSVKVDGSQKGVSTDANGNFQLLFSRPSTLIFTSIGFKTQRFQVNTQSAINIRMEEDLAGQQLNEVVVVGYGTQKKADITGSVVSVPKERLSQLPITNVLQAIQGSVAGVNISSGSAVPGSQPAALIRGQNSINAQAGPYVVVDGIPLSKTGGSLNDINPNDILSVEILKDASATAIYGVNGSNGVLLITTKRGTTGKPVIRYNGYAGVENIANLLKPRNGAEYVQKYADFLKQTGQTQTSPVPNFGELQNYNAGIETDWMKLVNQTGIFQDHNLSVSGGTPDVKYFISGDLLNQKGVTKGYQYQRVSLRSNLDINVTSFLTVGTSLFFTNNNYDGGRANLLFATAMSPYGQVYNANGTYAIYPMNPEQLYTNPLLGLTTDRVDRSANLNGNGYAEIKFPGILEGLKYRLNAGYTYLPVRRNSYVGREANDLLGTAYTFNSETRSYTLENLLTYNKDIQKHHFDFTALYSAQQRRYVAAALNGVGFINDELSFNSIGAATTISGGFIGNGLPNGSYSDQYRLNSQMGRVNYNYDGRYLLTLTARRDGSSVFGSNTTKYGVFPVAAVGWNIGNETFMKKLDFVNNLKIRFSYGQTGNEAINIYQTITQDASLRFPFNGISTIGVVPNVLGNNNLNWEKTTTANLGLDFGLIKNRINGTIEFYQSKTSDLLLSRGLPIITGYNNVFDNLGKTANKGIELTLTTRNFAETAFKWETSVVFAANRNKITQLYGDNRDDLGNRWFIGQPINVIYDYRMQGIWQNGEDASKQDPGAKPGDLKLADTNGDGRITADDRVILGQTAPKWTGGLTNTFHYKNFNLNVFIQTVQGVTKNNNDLNYGDETGRRNTPAVIGYWTSTNGNNTRPALSYNNTRGYGYASDASYTRIKDVTLSYVFTSKILEKLNLGSLTLYASGRNLYTFTNWIGWDPESNYAPRGSGDWVNNYPVTRSFVFGANISLK